MTTIMRNDNDNDKGVAWRSRQALSHAISISKLAVSPHPGTNIHVVRYGWHICGLLI